MAKRLIWALSLFFIIFDASAERLIVVDALNLLIYSDAKGIQLFDGQTNTPLLALPAHHIVIVNFALASAMELGSPIAIDLDTKTVFPYCKNTCEHLLVVDPKHVKKLSSHDNQIFEYFFVKDGRMIKLLERYRGQQSALAYRFDEMLSQNRHLTIPRDARESLVEASSLRGGLATDNEWFHNLELLLPLLSLKDRSKAVAIPAPLPVASSAPRTSLTEAFVSYFSPFYGFYPLGLHDSN